MLLGLQVVKALWIDDPKSLHFDVTSFFNDFLGGGFKYVLFSPLFGEDLQFD